MVSPDIVAEMLVLWWESRAYRTSGLTTKRVIES